MSIKNYPAIRYLILLLFFLPGLEINSSAQSLKYATSLLQNKDWSFVENKGQLGSSDIQYYGHSQEDPFGNGGISIHCKKDRIVFLFSRAFKDSTASIKAGIPYSKVNQYANLSVGKGLTTPETQMRIDTARIEMQFMNSDTDVQIMTTEPQQYHENFYGPASPDGLKVQSFKKLTYKNIYPYIDLVLSCQSNGMEYSFVVYPGGNLNDIQIQWNGTANINSIAANVGIQYENRLGFVKENGLKGYLNTGKRLNCNYLIKQRRVGFAVENYNKNRVLTIDPFLSWGSYYGGSGDESGTNIVLDDFNNVYVVGQVGSQGLATKGSYQDSLGHNGTLILVKFDRFGNRLWATYYPAKLYDEPFGLAIDKENNIYIAGSTMDTIGVATTGTWQDKLSGRQNSFIAKFDPSGTRIWGTYFGSYFEGALGLAMDRNDNPVMLGYASTGSNIATSGAYSTKVVSATSGTNAFVAKFTPSGKRLWCTYCGDIQEFNIAIDSRGAIYLSGYSVVKNLGTAGSFQPNLKDSEDGYMIKIDSSGTKRIWSTYFGTGTSFSGLNIDDSDYIYLCGYTSRYSDTSLYVTKGVWQTNAVGGSVPYIEKFKTDGSRVWGTFFGGAGSDRLECITTDQNGNVYVGGLVTDNSNMLKPCFESPFNRTKAVLARFSPVGQRIWAIQYGGNNYSQIAGLALDQNANIYTVGVTGSFSGIATNGAFQTSFGGTISSTSGDMFIAKFGNSFQNADYYGDTAVCNFTEHVYFADSTPCAMFHWTAVGGTIVKGQNSDSVYVQWNDSQASSLTCIITGMVNDTVTKKISIYKPAPGHSLQSFTSCSLSLLQIGFHGNKNDKFIWTGDSIVHNDSVSNPVIFPSRNGTYYLTETNAGGCKTIDTVVVHINPIPAANTGGDHIICFGNSVSLGDSAVPGNSYSWTSIPAGFNSSQSELSVTPTLSTRYYLTETINATGCKRTDSAFIIVNPLPLAIIGKDTSICAFSKFQLGAAPIGGHTYRWTNNISPTFQASTSSIIIYPQSTVTYFLTETIDITKCSKSDSVTIKVIPFIKPDAGISQVICKGDLVQIGANAGQPGYTYLWRANPPSVFLQKSKIIVSPTVTTRYYLFETDLSTGCSGTDSTIIFVNPLPKPKIQGPGNLCENDISDTYKTKNDTGASYFWAVNKGSLLSAQGKDSIVLKLNLGIDTVTVKETDTNGCQNTDTLLVHDFQVPDAHWKLLSDSPLSVFKAYDSTEQYYRWIFGDGATGSTYLASHMYPFEKDSSIDVSLTVGSEFGCSTTFDSTIKIRYVPPIEFYIDVFPNPFNETTNIKISLEKASHIQISAYDAIGKHICKLADIQQPVGIKYYEFSTAKYDLASGVYYLEVLVDGKLYTRPVVKVE